MLDALSTAADSAVPRMKVKFDRLSQELSTKYVHYLETFTATIEVTPAAIEFRCAFALLSDHEGHRYKLTAPTLHCDTEGERDLVLAMIFQAMEYTIVDLITHNGTAIN